MINKTWLIGTWDDIIYSPKNAVYGPFPNAILANPNAALIVLSDSELSCQMYRILRNWLTCHGSGRAVCVVKSIHEIIPCMDQQDSVIIGAWAESQYVTWSLAESGFNHTNFKYIDF